MAKVGPGAEPDYGEEPRPLLEGAGPDEYVTILNPLSDDFVAKVGVTKPVAAPISMASSQDAPGVTRTEQDVRSNYQLDLRNPDYQAQQNVSASVTLPAGKHTRLLGDVAQVALRQLVNEMMSRENKRASLADPYARREYEQTCVISRGSLNEIVQARTVDEQINEALNKETNEEEFPELRKSTGDSKKASGKPGSPGKKAKSGSEIPEVDLSKAPF